MALLRALPGLVARAAIAGIAMTCLAAAQPVGFDELPGWAEDDHAAALAVFSGTCDLIRPAPGTTALWSEICAMAPRVTSSRLFFELYFQPVVIGAPPALFTAYYEPELPASRHRAGRYVWPIYGKPPEFNGRSRWHSRAEIEKRGLLRGRGLEIAWLDDPVEAFFLQVQGSGRLRLADGSVLRVGFAAKNNHPYRSIGAELVRRGALPRHRVSAQAIKDWARRNPGRRDALLAHNPSFVFFRKLPNLPPHLGPIGAMGRSVTTMRSLAVDPAHVPLGAPVWVETEGAAPIRRLMVAQDTGSAIKGAQRGDLFFGTGAAAGAAAGRVRDVGRIVTLLPRPRPDSAE